MPQEQEELKLVVTLDDQASAKLADLQEKLGRLSAAPGLEKMGEQSAKATAGIKAMHSELAGLASRAGFIGGVVGGITSELAKMGVETIQRAADIQGLALEMTKFSAIAQRLGTSTAQMQANINAFREVGVSSGDAIRNIQGFTAAMNDLALVNGTLRLEVLRGGFLPINQMLAGLNQIDSAKTLQDKAKATQDLGKAIREFWTAHGGAEFGAQKEREFFTRVGSPDLDLVIGKILTISQLERELGEARDVRAKEFNKQTAQTQILSEQIVESIGGLLIQLSLASGITERWNGFLTSIRDTIHEIEHYFNTPTTPEQKAAKEKAFNEMLGGAPAVPFYSGGGAGGGGSRAMSGTRSDFWDKIIPERGAQNDRIEDRRDLEDNTEETKALTDQIKTLNDIFAHPQPGGLAEALGMGNLGAGGRRGGGGGSAPQGLPSPSGDGGGGGRSVPQGLLSPFGGRGGGGGGGGGGGESISSDVGTGGGVATGTVPRSIQQGAGADTGGGGGTPSVPLPRRRPEGGGTTGTLTHGAGTQELGAHEALAIAQRHLGEDEIRDEGKLGAFFARNGVRISPKTTAWCAAFVNASLNEAGMPGTKSLAAASFYKYGSAVKGAGQEGDIAVWPHHVAMLTGETRVGAHGERQYEVVGGNQGGTVSGKGGVSRQWRSGMTLRRPSWKMSDSNSEQLDGDSHTVNVNGKGHLKVDINAPPGTRASADGNGLLKDTSISQQTQMVPAQSGPAAE